LKKLLSILAAAACASAYSLTWHEAWEGTEAGQTLATAHVTHSASGALDAIDGTLPPGDCDMFKINISNEAAFDAILTGTTFDSIFFLFDTSGNGVVMNDDNPGGGLYSHLTTALVTANGDYYLAIVRYSGRPNNAASQPIWVVGTAPFNVEKAPDGAGAPGPLSAWSNLSASASIGYTITLTGCSAAVTSTDQVNPGIQLQSVGVAPATVVGGSANATGTATLNAAAPAGGITVTLSSSNPAAASVPANVVIAATTTSNTFTVTTFSVVSSTNVTITGTYNSINKTANLQVDPPPSPGANGWNEEHSVYSNPHGDAGELIGTSQMTVGNGALNTIYGRISAANDVDMFRIKIKDPANFAASTVNAGTTLDTQLWLFDANGMGIVMDDDEPAPGTTLQSKLSNAFTGSLTVNGIYYLAISLYDRDAMDTTPNQLWLDTVGGSFRVEHAPDDLGAANPLDSWGGSSTATGNYQIDLTNCSFAQSAVVTVLPSSFVVSPGSIVAGGLSEAQLSDDQYLEIRPGVVFSNALDPCAVAFTGTAPGNTPSLLEAVVEARSTANFIRMNIQAWDYSLGTPAYVTVGAAVNPLPFGVAPDVVATRTLSAAQNIGPANEMKLKLSFKATAAVFSYPWKPRIDQCSWRYTN
jgi:hypothetical protein